ncbi:MAG: gliding motility-associated C-terminal domain-containing protein, partial [Cyclobacteriaceae bacterium]
KAEGFEFVVYDRRGIEVFSSDDLNRMQNTGWNGNSVRTGEMLPQGSYVYAMKAINRRNEKVERTGTITVMK